MPDPDLTSFRDELAKIRHDVMDEFLLSALSEVSIDSKEFENFFVGLAGESDRGLAIVAFSYIDERLRNLLLNACNPKIYGGPKKLFEAFGPLANASAMIELSAALFWIDHETYNNLRILRRIRNRFAHYPFAANFDDPAVVSLIDSLTPVEKGMFDAFPQYFIPVSEMARRQLFHVRAVIVCERMLSELATAPTAQRMGQHPWAAIHMSSDKLLDAIKNLREAAVGVLLEIAGTRLVKEATSKEAGSAIKLRTPNS